MNLNKLRKAAEYLEEYDSIGKKLARAMGVSPLYTRTKGTNRGKNMKRKSNGKSNGKRALQGKYMGQVRWLTSKDKKAVSKVRAEKGYSAAIRLAKSLKRKEA